LGRLQRIRGKLVEADDLFAKALSLDAENPDALQLYYAAPLQCGTAQGRARSRKTLRALEPYVPAFIADFGDILWENGQDAAAIETLHRYSSRVLSP